MLVKSKLNNLLVIFLIFFASCKTSKQFYNTKISCPSGLKILVRFTNVFDVRRAIEKAAFDKKKYGTNENYTVVRLPGERSFKIEKITPQEALNCTLQDFPVKVSKRDKEVYLPYD
jgi:hypothetical protein